MQVQKTIKHHACKESHGWNPSPCGCETNRYLKSVADGLVITFDEIIDVLETVLINLNESEAACKMDRKHQTKETIYYHKINITMKSNNGFKQL